MPSIDSKSLTCITLRNITDGTRIVVSINMSSITAFIFAFSFSALSFAVAPKCGDVPEPKGFARIFQKNQKWLKTQEIRNQLKPSVAQEVSTALKEILEKGFSREDGEYVDGAEFNALYDSLIQYARKYGIQISKTKDTIGVFPRSLFEVQTSGFDKVNPDIKDVNFAARHELAHLFHVIQVRAIVIESLNLRDAQDKNYQAANSLVELFESGRNYREFEQMVTEISGFPHVLNKKWRTENLYQEAVIRLLDGVNAGLFTGRLDFKDQVGIVKLYALFLSRAPLVVGKSLGDLAIRMPFILFSTQYLLNPDFKAWVHQMILQVI